MTCWAVRAADGTVAIRYDDPALHDDPAGLAGCTVHVLAREPDAAVGETVGPSGKIEFRYDLVRARIETAIKAEAERRIVTIAPLWRQINDTTDPSPEGTQRRLAIKAVRAWSNALEQEVAGLTSAAVLRAALANAGVPV